jgi:hypothetical protein
MLRRPVLWQYLGPWWIGENMAAKKRKGTARVTTPPTITTRIVLDVSDATASYYVNYVEIGHTPSDFTVTCGRVPGKPSMAQLAVARETGELRLDSPVQITIPVNVLPAVIDALTLRREMYEQQYGAIKTPEVAHGSAQTKH